MTALEHKQPPLSVEDLFELERELDTLQHSSELSCWGDVLLRLIQELREARALIEAITPPEPEPPPQPPTQRVVVFCSKLY